MYKVDVNQLVEKALERRRSAETARKARIFNTRQRVMGVDLDALNQQVQERKHQQNTEKQWDKHFDVMRTYQDKLLLQQDMNEKAKREALQKNLIQHWSSQQCDPLNADLKCGLKGAVNITMPEADLGPASMQIFQGEDIGWQEMRKDKQKTTERDLLAQINENQRRQMEEKQKEVMVHKMLLLQDQRGTEQAALEEECKKTSRIALGNYNQALAAEQAENLAYQQRKEDRENLAEVLHTLTSDMMTECAEAAEREMGDGRLPQIVPDRWKGMRPEQLDTIYREQEQQRIERQRQRDAEKIQAAAWDLQLLNLSRKTEEEERRAAELRKKHRIKMAHFNMQLAQEQHAHQEFLDKKLYTNKPTKDYFNQFNTSSR